MAEIMKGITCCADCAYYNMKKHKCTRATDEGKPTDHFYADCPLPTVIKAQGWVSVKDRLPKENTAVNVVWVNHNPESYYAYIKDKPFTATAVYYDENWYWWDDTIEDVISEYGGRAPIAGMIDLDIEITHWQSLPEPPKEDRPDANE